ncbi:D-alanyl-D-alanine carboxypeptidase family protein [Embleya sp. NPDC005971]|uniref:D-alanyl-D-alanine carboxypeptidase family protein n=1 Tax=unclassified Embleya TaxID=2699296 RepID=UPI003401D31F
MRHAAGSGPQPDEGGTPDGAHFLDTSWQQHTMGTAGTSGAAGTPAPSGRFDAATTPVPADWYQREQPAASAAPAAAEPARSARQGDGDDPEPPRRSRRGLVVWALAGALVLGGLGVGAVLFLGGDDDKKDKAGSVGAQVPPAPTTAPNTTAAPTTAPTTKATSSTKPSSTKSASSSATAKPPANDVDSPKDPKALKPAAYAAWKRIDTAMAAEGITLNLNSGKRGWAHQQRLLDEKIAEVGSREEALRWVLPPEKSMHVQGVAIDIYPANAQAWLQAKGSKYGWCRMYDNEEWHFEYNSTYTSGCPKRLPSATE